MKTAVQRVKKLNQETANDTTGVNSANATRRRIYSVFDKMSDVDRGDRLAMAARRMGLDLSYDVTTIGQAMRFIDKHVDTGNVTYHDFYNAIRVSDAIEALGSAEKEEDKSADTTESDSGADILFQHFSMLVDPGAMNIVKPALQKLSKQMVKNMKNGGDYDEILKAVAKVRKDLDKINSAYGELAKYVNKIMSQD